MDSNGDGFERCEALESCPVKGLKCAQWRLTPSLRGLFWGLPGGGRGVCGVWGCKECESTKIHEVKAVFLPFLVHFGGVSRQGEFKNINFFRKKVHVEKIFQKNDKNFHASFSTIAFVYFYFGFRCFSAWESKNITAAQGEVHVVQCGYSPSNGKEEEGA
jgi:hypothetical protein